MTREITFEIVAAPEISRRRKYDGIRQALLAAKPGECVKVPSETFKSNPMSALKPGTFTARKFHAYQRPDGWYLWLDPEPNGNGAKGGGA